MKRFYKLYLQNKFNETTTIQQTDTTAQYYVTENQLKLLRFHLSTDSNHDFIASLSKHLDDDIFYNQIIKLLKLHGLDTQKEMVLRILEKRWFHAYWSEEQYFLEKPNPNSENWELYFALLKEIKKVCSEKCIELLLFSTINKGMLDWNIDWFHMSPDETTYNNYRYNNIILKDFAKANQIGFVNSNRVYQAARNDPHPNAAGNEEMAADIYDYLLEHYAKQFELYCEQ